MKKMALVYKHYKKDTNELFYIGIGNNIKRAYSKRSRNDLWHNVVNKHGYYVEIHIDNISYNDAKKIEKALILLYGRKDLNNGILVNMTDGGDGHINMSNRIKIKISNKLKGQKQSEQTKEKRKKTLKEIWKNPDLIELKRKQTKELFEKGILNTKGRTSRKKGKPFDGDKEKLSNSLKEYYKTAKPHNFKVIEVDIKNQIKKDYKEGIKKFALHKKYNLNRKIIDRILNENN